MLVWFCTYVNTFNNISIYQKYDMSEILICSLEYCIIYYIFMIHSIINKIKRIK